ncbi:MAG: Gfo/Idh/MocA family oxidoreductase [Thermoguttaceae bacterium]|nr:Gfo/Idh/MocA family oxidoreductase [Thermoguttaceae bacterium]
MKFHRTTRRSFLGTSAALAATGVAAPLFVRSAMGQERNEKLRVAAIGVGGRGSGIGFQAADLGQMVACCDVHRGNAERFAAKIKQRGADCKIYNDYRELLADEKDIDAVTIGTPDHWHVKIAIEAMKAGKHVYCEKPLTLTMEEGVIVNQAVRKYGKVFQVGTQQRSEFNANFLKAVAIARSGRLGKQLTAISSVGKAASRSPDKDKPFGPFPTQDPPAELDWDLWLGPAPKVDFCNERIGWNFRWWFEYSGGQVTDWGVHHTDIAFWALSGEEGQAVEAVGTGEFMAVEREKVLAFLLGKIPPQEMPQAYNVAYSFDVDLTLSTGNVIKLVSGPNELLIEGERGRIRVNRGSLTGKPVEEVDADPKAKQEIAELMAKIYGGELPREPLAHMRNFFDCVKNGRPPVANVADHVRAVNACHLANIALVTGRKVTCDPKAGEFPGDAEATALMKRPRRAEYDIEI